MFPGAISLKCVIKNQEWFEDFIKDTMSSVHSINGITIIGGDLYEVDHYGNFINTVATIFPEYHLIVVDRRGIHADQIIAAAD